MLDARKIDDLKAWFADYVVGFTSKDSELQRNFDLKKKHTALVCAEIVGLGRQLGLDTEQLRLAEIMALFHDLGRFEQYARYGTFADSRSVDHAQLGVQILRDKKVLDGLEEGMRDLVLRAITWHNRVALPAEADASFLFFTRLLRDADKLDIWRVVTDYYRQDNPVSNAALEMGLSDTPEVSEVVAADLLAGHTVDLRQVQNLNDLKLLQVGWVYDLNFSPSFRRLREKGYLDIIRASLPVTETVNKIFAAVTSLLMRECSRENPATGLPGGTNYLPGHRA
ncbi:metal-dependent phosphohydrolase [Syntrophotalea carbinolica DSM 2380]|uniref:Metal-dependent phosphohydrolase n=2 Tax=Syntrophotalea carbinolica TaxID=19 RepID=Q3A4I3_SYNC1|nr:metal-dependent phosphohydrolase [Syntrophotalea carbinolica DSM 2380]